MDYLLGSQKSLSALYDQRIPVESVGAAKTLVAADSGKIFLLDAAAGFTVTLPAVSTAKAGWHCKFIINTNCTSNSYIITENTTSDTDVLISQFNELETDDNEDGESSTGHTTITFANAYDQVGDYVDIFCSGSKFYCYGQTALDSCVTLA